MGQQLEEAIKLEKASSKEASTAKKRAEKAEAELQQ